MLLWNLGQLCGLIVNGSSGTVKEILKDVLIIDVHSYVGRPFFQDAGEVRFVPIIKETVTAFLSDGVHFRTQYPVMLIKRRTFDDKY